MKFSFREYYYHADNIYGNLRAAQTEWEQFQDFPWQNQLISRLKPIIVHAEHAYEDNEWEYLAASTARKCTLLVLSPVRIHPDDRAKSDSDEVKLEQREKDEHKLVAARNGDGGFVVLEEVSVYLWHKE